jgi:hypothetical protein
MKPYVTYPFQFLSCIVLLIFFLWLTIGASFLIFERQKQVTNKTTSKSEAHESGKASIPFENPTEDKTENNLIAFSAEYLREDAEHFLYKNIPLKHTRCPDADLFVNFFGDSVSHPPESFPC